MDRTVKITIREKDDEDGTVSMGTLSRLGSTTNVMCPRDDCMYIFSICDKIVTITREGNEEDYQMLLHEGHDYSMTVNTIFGNIPMLVRPELVEVNDTPANLSINIVYYLINGDLKVKYRLYITCEYV